MTVTRKPTPPDVQRCAVRGCPMLVRGTYCRDHADEAPPSHAGLER